MRHSLTATWTPFLCAAIVFALTASASARIKLTTLPVRERVEIQLDNPSATLVEEERIVTLLAGSNQVDFSWANAAIDKATIQFRVVNMPLRPKTPEDAASILRPDGTVEMIQVISVAYPPNENSLVWEVFSEKPFAARVRISYVISNITRSFDYRAVADHDETALTLSNYIRLANVSSEDFGPSAVWAGFGDVFQREIGANEAKQMLAWKFPAVPIRKTYTFDWYRGQVVPSEPDQRYVAMRYVLVNDKARGMGLFPLQGGKVRIFQNDGRGGEAFTGEDWAKLTPIDDEMKLYLGLARDVVVRRKIARNDRHVIAGNLFDQDVVLEYRIENYKDSPAVLDLLEDMNRLRDDLCGAKDHDAQWQIVPEGTTVQADRIERKDSRTFEAHLPLDAAPKGETKVAPVIVAIHLQLKNEW